MINKSCDYLINSWHARGWDKSLERFITRPSIGLVFYFSGFGGWGYTLEYIEIKGEYPNKAELMLCHRFNSLGNWIKALEGEIPYKQKELEDMRAEKIALVEMFKTLNMNVEIKERNYGQ